MARAHDDVHVEEWDDLRRLPALMDDVGGQGAAVVRHARRWVADPAGFEPSPLCLLRPLAEAMAALDDAFAAFGRRAESQWEDLRDGVVVAERALRDSDEAATRASGLVRARVADADDRTAA